MIGVLIMTLQPYRFANACAREVLLNKSSRRRTIVLVEDEDEDEPFVLEATSSIVLGAWFSGIRPWMREAIKV